MARRGIGYGIRNRYTSGMKLHELHVLERQAGSAGHGQAVAGARVSARAGQVAAANAAGR